MKALKRVYKSLKSKDVAKDYKGEDSPYWEFLAKVQGTTEDGRLVDDPFANPDVLSEEDSLYNRPLSEDGNLRVEIIKEVMATLTLQQQKVLQLCGFDGQTEEAAANELGIKRRTLRTTLSRIRTKIHRLYEQRSKADGW